MLDGPNMNVLKLKKIARTLVAATLFSVCFAACSKPAKAIQKLQTTNLTLIRADGTRIQLNAEMAITKEEQMKGFMERKDIPEGTGMIFINQEDAIRTFWMKNTPTPLSIAYISSTGKIKDIFDMQPYSITPVSSTSHVKYALEVPQGWFVKNNIKVGDILQLDF